MIVLEGPDNSGKTTLADALRREFAFEKFTAGPAPSTHDELVRCLHDQEGRIWQPCIHDRVTCISQQVYSGRDAMLDAFLRRMAGPAVIVYCRAPERTLMDFSTHRVKGYDTEESLRRLMDRQHEYIGRYDDLMSTVGHVKYDWTDEGLNKDGFIQFVHYAMMDESIKRNLYGLPA